MSRVNRFEYKDWKGLGKRIKMYREQISMSKENFAEKINCSENYVAELEKGNVGTSVHTLHQISQTLKIPVDSLLYGEIRALLTTDEVLRIQRPALLVMVSGENPAITNSPDLHLWYFNETLGLGNPEWNTNIRDIREKSRKIREIHPQKF